jgi:hypothetical protein
MNTRMKSEGSEMTLAIKAGIACAIVVGLLVAAGTQGQGGVVQEATAAVQTDDGYTNGYFPAQFPAPQGPIEPHIEAF